MDEMFEISIWHRGPESRVICRGELDVYAAPRIEEAFDVVVETQPSVLFIDWRSVSVLTSDVAAVFLRATRKCHERGVKVRVAASPAAQRVLDILGWNHIDDAQEGFALPIQVEDALHKVISANGATHERGLRLKKDP